VNEPTIGTEYATEIPIQLMISTAKYQVINWIADTMECGNLYTLTQYKSAHVCIQCGAPSENTILLAVIDSSVIARTARFAYTHPG